MAKRPTTKKRQKRAAKKRPNRRGAKPPAGKPTAPPQQQMSPQQAAEGLAAVLEVVSGAPSHRILELAGKIEVGKMALQSLISQIAAGALNAAPGAADE